MCMFRSADAWETWFCLSFSLINRWEEYKFLTSVQKPAGVRRDRPGSNTTQMLLYNRILQHISEELSGGLAGR